MRIKNFDPLTPYQGSKEGENSVFCDFCVFNVLCGIFFMQVPEPIYLIFSLEPTVICWGGITWVDWCMYFFIFGLPGVIYQPLYVHICPFLGNRRDNSDGAENAQTKLKNISQHQRYTPQIRSTCQLQAYKSFGCGSVNLQGLQSPTKAFLYVARGIDQSKSCPLLRFSSFTMAGPLIIVCNLLTSTLLIVLHM